MIGCCSMKVEPVPDTSVSCGNDEGLVVLHKADVTEESLVQYAVYSFLVVVASGGLPLHSCSWSLQISLLCYWQIIFGSTVISWHAR